MSEKTWSNMKGHHWFDKAARDEMPLIEVTFGYITTPMKGGEHVRAHQDTKLLGRIGAVARDDVIKIIDGESLINY